MIKIECIERKPTHWGVRCGNSVGIVGKSPRGVVRRHRWYLLLPGEPTVRFPSRRAAFHYFEHGTKFSPRPAYARTGRDKGARIR